MSRNPICKMLVSSLVKKFHEMMTKLVTVAFEIRNMISLMCQNRQEGLRSALLSFHSNATLILQIFSSCVSLLAVKELTIRIAMTNSLVLQWQAEPAASYDCR